MQHKSSPIIAFIVVSFFISCSGSDEPNNSSPIDAKNNNPNQTTKNNNTTKNSSPNQSNNNKMMAVNAVDGPNSCAKDAECGESNPAEDYYLLYIRGYCRSASNAGCEPKDCLEGSFCVSNVDTYCTNCTIKKACMEPGPCNGNAISSEDCAPGEIPE